MIKKILLVAISAILITACGGKKDKTEPLTAENAFLLTVVVDGILNEDAYINKLIENEYETIDTVPVIDGILTYSKPFEGSSEIIFIKFNDYKKPLKVMTELGNVSIRVDVSDIRNSFTVEQGELNTLMQNFYQEMNAYEDAITELEKKEQDAVANGTKEDLKNIEEKYQKIEKERKQFVISYVADNSNNMVAPYLADRHLYTLNYEELYAVTHSFSDNEQKSIYVASLNKRLSILEKIMIGAQAPNFTQNTPDGKPISLNSLKGNYLLIDFWAAWCGPCRAENPNLVALYNKYHSQGLDILGVSFDKNVDAWQKGIEEDGLLWTQISDLKGWSNEAGKLYGIRSIPQNVLLDPNGIIIAKNLYGDDLTEKVKEVLAKKES